MERAAQSPVARRHGGGSRGARASRDGREHRASPQDPRQEAQEGAGHADADGGGGERQVLGRARDGARLGCGDAEIRGGGRRDDPRIHPGVVHGGGPDARPDAQDDEAHRLRRASRRARDVGSGSVDRARHPNEHEVWDGDRGAPSDAPEARERRGCRAERTESLGKDGEARRVGGARRRGRVRVHAREEDGGGAREAPALPRGSPRSPLAHRVRVRASQGGCLRRSLQARVSRARGAPRGVCRRRRHAPRRPRRRDRRGGERGSEAGPLRVAAPREDGRDVARKRAGEVGRAEARVGARQARARHRVQQTTGRPGDGAMRRAQA